VRVNVHFIAVSLHTCIVLGYHVSFRSVDSSTLKLIV